MFNYYFCFLVLLSCAFSGLVLKSCRDMPNFAEFCQNMLNLYIQKCVFAHFVYPLYIPAISIVYPFYIRCISYVRSRYIQMVFLRSDKGIKKGRSLRLTLFSRYILMQTHVGVRFLGSNIYYRFWRSRLLSFSSNCIGCEVKCLEVLAGVDLWEFLLHLKWLRRWFRKDSAVLLLIDCKLFFLKLLFS